MTPEKDDFRLGYQRPTDLSLHPKTDSSASGAAFRPCSAVFGSLLKGWRWLAQDWSIDFAPETG